MSIGDTIRDPIHGEFFATYAISDPGMALIREGIQNSLDAGRPDEVVRVGVFVSGDARAAARSDVARYLAGALAHLKASDNGLRREEISDWSALVLSSLSRTSEPKVSTAIPPSRSGR